MVRQGERSGDVPAPSQSSCAPPQSRPGVGPGPAPAPKPTHNVVAARPQPAVALRLGHEVPHEPVAGHAGGKVKVPVRGVDAQHIQRRAVPQRNMHLQCWWEEGKEKQALLSILLSCCSVCAQPPAVRSYSPIVPLPPQAPLTAAVKAERVPLSEQATASVEPAGMWPTRMARAARARSSLPELQAGGAGRQW